MKKRILCIDCDGVIFNIIQTMQKILAEINYILGPEFEEKNIKEAERNKNFALADKYRRIRKITTDEVLEERREFYKNRIRYRELYQLKNTFYGVVDMINAICDAEIFDEVYITTHVNSLDEIYAKQEFFGTYLPKVKVFTIPFLDAPYDDNKDNYYENFNRQRTNKPVEFFKATGHDPEYTTFIDDGKSICAQATDLGSTAYHCESDKVEPLLVFQQMLADLGVRLNLGDSKKMTLF